MNRTNRTFLIVGGVIALILVIAGIAVVASGGDDTGTDGSGATEATTEGGETASGDVEQSRPVELTGDVLVAFDDPSNDPAVGVASPVVTGQGFDGTPITIGGPSEGPTMLVFLAHWCPHCNAEIPELIEVNDRGGIPSELNVIGVSTAVAADRPNYPPSEWIVDKGWPWPTMADDAQSSAFVDFGGSGFPFLVILDADGTVLARQSGESSADDIQAWIESTLATANV